ncbi:hypothetical protein N9V27_01030 [bacterium]|nr:hypothetical protein [bacterium]
MIVNLEIVLVAIVIALISFVVLFLRSSWQSHKDEQLAKAVQMVLDHAFVLMKIEETDGKLMAYRTITNEFIAEGNSFEELSKHFLERFPSKTGLFPGQPELRIEAVNNAI